MKNSRLHYETYGPVTLPEKFYKHYLCVKDIFLQKVGVDCAHISFDIVEDSKGDIYTLDINSRMGTRFSALLYYRDANAFGETVITSFLEKKSQLPQAWRLVV